jgi:sulfur-oxidizing protein SoxZ
MTSEFGTSVAKNPYLQFVIKCAKAGEKISLTWKDSKGATRTDEAVIT